MMTGEVMVSTGASSSTHVTRAGPRISRWLGSVRLVSYGFLNGSFVAVEMTMMMTMMMRDGDTRQDVRASAAAQRIQAAFRGWRTRMRVVWRVREQLSGFMEGMERDVETERVLLGLARPQQFQWLVDDDNETRKTLHLPRICDDVFGIISTFPDVLHAEVDGQALDGEANKQTPRQEQSNVTEENNEEEVPCISQDEPLLEEDQPCVELSEIAQLEELPMGSLVKPSSDHDSEAGIAANQDNAAEGFDRQVEEAPHPLHEVHASPTTGTTGTPPDEEADLPSRDSSFDALDIQEAGASLTSDSTASPPDAAPPGKEVDQLSGDVSLDVDEILRMHSKDEILLEIEWAKQALRDRLEYLSRRHNRTCT